MEKQKSIGALWEKTSPKGKYMSGQIEYNGEKINIVVFINGHKKEQKHPDWKIYVSQPKEQKQDSQEVLNNLGHIRTQEEIQEGIDVSEIPF